MAETDGSIVLTVTIDSSQIQSGIQNIVSDINKQVQAEGKNVIAVEKVNQAKAKTQQEQQKVLLNEEKLAQEKEKTRQQEEKTKQAVEQTKQATEKTTTAQNKLKSASSSTLTVVKQLATQLGIIFSVRQIIQFTNESSKLASQTEANVARLSELYGSAAKSVYDFANANANAFGMSKTAAYDAAADYGNIFTTFASGAESAELTQQMLQATAVIASKTGRTYDDVFEKIRSGLYGNTRAIDDLGLSVRQSSLEQTKAYQKISNNGTRSWNSLTDAELQNARALGIIEQATEKYGDTVLESSALVRSRLNAAWEDFKSSWGSIVNIVLVPIMSALTSLLQWITSGLELLYKFTGKAVGVSNSASQQIQSNTNAQTEAQDEYNDSLKEGVASFDEINIVSETEDDSVAGEGTGTAPQATGAQEGTEAVESAKSALAGLIEILVGIGLIALGVVMIFLGHIIIAILLISLGVMSLVLGGETLMNSDVFTDTEQALDELMRVVRIALVAIGVIMLFVGHVILAVALITAGIALIIGHEIDESGEVDDGEKTKSEVSGWLDDIVTIVAAFMLILGVFLLFFGVSIPLAISLIIGGAAILVYKEVNQSEVVSEDVEKWLNIILAIIAGVVLVIGIIMMMLGHITPLSIGLVIAGAAGLVAEAGLNWDKLKEMLQGKIGVIVGIVSGALLVLGIILCAAGVSLPLGIALIAAGAAGLVATVMANKDAILDWIKGAWEGIKSFFSDKVLPFLKDMVNGMIGAFEDFLNFITGGVRLLWDGIAWMVEGLAGVLGFDIEIGRIPEFKLPRLAKGAVIPANHEFLAILGDQKHGTNIEAPADLIKQMVSEALDERGYTGQQSDTIVTVPVYLGTRQIAEEVIKVSEAKGTQLVKGGFAYAR